MHIGMQTPPCQSFCHARECSRKRASELSLYMYKESLYMCIETLNSACMCFRESLHVYLETPNSIFTSAFEDSLSFHRQDVVFFLNKN